MKHRPKNTDDCLYNLVDIIKTNKCTCMDIWKEDSIEGY